MKPADQVSCGLRTCLENGLRNSSIVGGAFSGSDRQDFSHVGAGTKGDCCEFKRGQVMWWMELSLGRVLEEA